jgi:energy-coupling factor transporter ATP-binding protein EcfA2
MINFARIAGYRGLQDLSIDGLGRINLLVGKNNSGKTSVLESLFLIATRADPAAIWQILSRRGEYGMPSPNSGQASHVEADICHLFHGHAMDIGTQATIQTRNQSLVLEVSQVDRNAHPALFAHLQAQALTESIGSRHMLSITGNPKPLAAVIPLSDRGGVRRDILPMLTMNSGSARDASPHQFITTDSLSILDIQSKFSQIALTAQEDLVVRALQFIEPGIERIAATASMIYIGAGGPARGGLKVKLSGQNEPVPIGSLGEGIWRLLALAIAISSARDGLLLVDEIDIGLHYSVLEKMWSFIADAAKEFNVQVFATTHSADCVNSLASLCHTDKKAGSEVTIQRIEAGEKQAVAYDEAEIVTIARNRIEAR